MESKEPIESKRARLRDKEVRLIRARANYGNAATAWANIELHAAKVCREANKARARVEELDAEIDALSQDIEDMRKELGA